MKKNGKEFWSNNWDCRQDYTSEHYKEMGKRFLQTTTININHLTKEKTIGLEMEITLKFLDEKK
jgi:hypothetical protein